MKKRNPAEWWRPVAVYQRGRESRRPLRATCGLAASTLDYWRRRERVDGNGRLVEVEVDAGGGFAGGLVPGVVITWTNGVYA
jgi:hypothetical protein